MRLARTTWHRPFAVRGFQHGGCPGRSSSSTKYALGKYLQQVEAPEVSRKADKARAKQTAERITTLERENYRWGCPDKGITGKTGKKGASDPDMGRLGRQDAHTYMILILKAQLDLGMSQKSISQPSD